MKVSLPILFRRTPYNKYSIPILAGAIETAGAGATRLAAPSKLFTIDSLSSLGDFKKIYNKAIICYSFMTPQMDQVRKEISLIRSLYKDSFILLAGGPHPTGDPEGTLSLDFDAVFIGEGEISLPHYINRILEGGAGDEKVIEAKEPLTSRELDSHLPFSKTLGIGAPMELSRGCFFNCGFCQTRRIFKTRVIHRSPESILTGASISASGGRENIYFISPNGLAYGASEPGRMNLGCIEDLCKNIRGCGIKYINLGYFPSEVRPDYITPESLATVKKYCANRKIALGIQTGSESMMKRLRRGHTVSCGLNAVRLVREFGLTAHCDFILGFPGETEGEMKESMNVMVEIVRKYGARIHAHYYIPLPGTPLWESDMEPSPLSRDTKKMLLRMESWGQLDGWWQSQEKLSRKILTWRKKGYIKSRKSIFL